MKTQEKKVSFKEAVALRYDPDQEHAPRVTAKGKGNLAQKIIALGRKNGVPIQEDPALVQILSQLEFYQEIPPSLYLVVAEILVYIYSLDHQYSYVKSQKK
jgi:flagellar biosynthesis protein